MRGDEHAAAGEPTPEPDEWMRHLGTLPLMSQPEEQWQYHISNDLLGVLAAKIDRLPPSYAPDPRAGEMIIWGEAVGGRYSTPPAFQSGGGGLTSTVDDYHAYFRMLLNGGRHGRQWILSRPAVELMTTNRLPAEQLAARETLARNFVHVSYGTGQHGGWGFGMAVRTYRGDFALIGQFGWDGGTGTSTYADPDNRLIGILLTQVGMSTPDSARAMHDFWTTLYQVVDD
nr:serine hydrolase domain-containing protein [Spongiactinospora rosea]